LRSVLSNNSLLIQHARLRLSRIVFEAFLNRAIASFVDRQFVMILILFFASLKSSILSHDENPRITHFSYFLKILVKWQKKSHCVRFFIFFYFFGMGDFVLIVEIRNKTPLTRPRTEERRSRLLQRSLGLKRVVPASI
jgi:hypothetical protein